MQEVGEALNHGTEVLVVSLRILMGTKVASAALYVLHASGERVAIVAEAIMLHELQL